jgi:adenylyltransferase/sulfurtransferase
MTEELHSRSIAAGYDPEILRAAKVLVAGLGAVGQNVVQALALFGVGRLLLVDHDVFVEHNATRSPFYPTEAEAARLGRGKAAVVAHKAAVASTAADGRIYYAPSLVQELGDGAVRWADVVVAAVDTMNARAWLAERCRLLGRPMVEGGMLGADFNLAVFTTTAGAACYRCGIPNRESSMSCAAYTREAERAAVVPAIQTTAQVLAGYQVAAATELLHGTFDNYGTRFHGTTRLSASGWRISRLPPNPRCPGEHQPLPVIASVGHLDSRATVQDLVAEISAAAPLRGATITLAEPVISSANCTQCDSPCSVRALESRWLVNPRCADCGGPWPVTDEDEDEPDCQLDINTADQLPEELACVPLRDIGVRAGSSLVATLRDGQRGLLQLDGDILAYVERAAPLLQAFLPPAPANPALG